MGNFGYDQTPEDIDELEEKCRRISPGTIVRLTWHSRRATRNITREGKVVHDDRGYLLLSVDVEDLKGRVGLRRMGEYEIKVETLGRYGKSMGWLLDVEVVDRD